MEEGGGEFVDDFDEGIVFEADVDFSELSALHSDSVDGEGVEVFVGEDAAGDVAEGEGVGDDGVGAFYAVNGSSIDGDISEGIGEGGGKVGGEVEDVSCEESGARTELHGVEGGWVA